MPTAVQIAGNIIYRKSPIWWMPDSYCCRAAERWSRTGCGKTEEAVLQQSQKRCCMSLGTTEGVRTVSTFGKPEICNYVAHFVPSVLWHCWLGVRKSIQPIKIEWCGTGVVICLECGANDFHMVQLMPLPPIISCISKIQNGLPFWCRLTQVVLEKGR